MMVLKDIQVDEYINMDISELDINEESDWP